MLRAELRRTLRDVDLDVRLEVTTDRPVALLGRSGAGKTTVLRMLAGLARPDAGTVACDGRTWCDTARGIDLAPEVRRCALLHQDDALFPHLSAWRNVAYGMAHVPRGARHGEARALLERFGVAGLAEERPPGLSGGERRRVALARAVAARPAVLLLDEPFTGLDPTTRDDVRAAVREAIALAAVPAIVVTHDSDDVPALGARAVLLRDGRLHDGA